MGAKDVGATTSIQDWNFQQNYVERIMDNAAFTAAHPNNTLVLAGPARLPAGNPDDHLWPIGMVQQFNMGHSSPVQPMQAIGSGRSFFVKGKGQISLNIGRLWVNGRNLLRVLYTTAVNNGLDVSQFSEPPVRSNSTEQFYLNLDSELFYIPFGMAVLFRSVSNDLVGAFYIELCMLNSWSTGIAAGQNFVMEQVSGVADRIRPIYPDTLTGDTDSPTSSQLITTMFPTQAAQPSASLETR